MVLVRPATIGALTKIKYEVNTRFSPDVNKGDGIITYMQW